MNRRSVFKGVGAVVAMATVGNETQAQSASDTVYELRVYHLNPGKLPLILERFRSKETAIFARCGMEGVAYWVPAEDGGPQGVGEIKAGQTLVYMLRHASREQAKANWSKFSHDPEWVALKAETEKDGVFVSKVDSTFLKLTDFSPKV